MPITSSDLCSVAFFQGILPFLTFDGPAPPLPSAAPPPSTWHARLTAHGFVRLTPRQVWGEAVPEAYLRTLSLGVTRLAELGLPLSLLSVSKEAQAVAGALQGLLHQGLGSPSHACIGDWAFFHVDSAAQGKGWEPHRDRMRHQGALAADGSPAYITCWMPLSSATPEASCLYFVPRDKDPGYEQGDAGQGSSGEGSEESGSAAPPPNPLAAAFSSPACWQNIIGLPTARGGLLCFSSRTLHWGGAPLASDPSWEAEEGPRAPRQALSIAFATPHYELPALARPLACAEPSFEEAVALACGQALLYHSQAPLPSAAVARALLGVVQGLGEGLLEEGYRGRVLAAGSWVAFSTAFGESGKAGAPSAAEVALAFAGRAAADEGLDVSLYA